MGWRADNYGASTAHRPRYPAGDAAAMRSVIYEHYGKPFRYGDGDCCAFVGKCLESAGKPNPMRFFAYANEAEAREIIAQYGTLSDAITAVMGDPIPDVRDVQENDVVVVSQLGEQIAGIAHRTDMGLRCVMRTKRGVVDWPIDRALQAWRP